MKKFASLAALVMLPVLSLVFSAPAFAAPGQLAGGSNLYKVRNVTQNGGYSSSISAVCNDTVKYSVEVSNTQYGALTDVTVKANLASGNINVSAKNDAGNTVTSNGHVTVSNNGTLQYIAGSTSLYTVSGAFVKTLADGVTSNGVNAGDLGGSTREFVQFQAKVKCEEQQPNDIQVCDLATKKVITIREDQYNATKHSKNLADCAATPVTPVTPTELPQTGATGGVVAIVASLLTAAAGYVATRKNVLG